LPVGGAAHRTFDPGVKNPHAATVAIPSPLPSFPFYFRLFSLQSVPPIPHRLLVPKLKLMCHCHMSKKLQSYMSACALVRLATELRTVELHDSSESSSAAEYTTSEKLSSRAARIDSPSHNVRVLFNRSTF